MVRVHPKLTMKKGKHEPDYCSILIPRLVIHLKNKVNYNIRPDSWLAV